MGRKNKCLTHASIFSGIGGFDLAAQWMGWENVFHCEINDFCRKLLKHYFPNAESYGDIKKTDFSKYSGKIDVLTGGFPCQPFSVAGKRLGKDDERHLWPDMLRAIREIQPQWVVGENVLGITSWNEGVVFEEVQSDLETEGYEVQPYVLPAAGVGAPHRRDRVWFIAYRIGTGPQEAGTGKQAEGPCQSGALDEFIARTDSKRSDAGQYAETHDSRRQAAEPFTQGDQVRGEHPPIGRTGISSDTVELGRDNGGDHRQERRIPGNKGASEEGEQERQERERGAGKAGQAAADPRGNGLQDKRPEPSGDGQEDEGLQAGRPEHEAIQDHWADWPTQSPVCDGDDGLSPLLDGITFPKWRVESIKAGGNAIVPQIAHRLFAAIQYTDEQLRDN